MPESPADPIYRDFPDADFSSWPYVNCASARAEMNRLRIAHGLTFWFNPGGGAFVGDHRNIQISACDDVLDLMTLRAALGKQEGE